MTPPPTPLSGREILVPPELLFVMLEALGGSFTATMSDLVRYHQDEHYMEIVKTADPPTLSVRLHDKTPAESAPNNALDHPLCTCPPPGIIIRSDCPTHGCKCPSDTPPYTANKDCPQHGLIATGRKCDCFFNPSTMQRTYKDSCKVHGPVDPDDADLPY